MWLENKQISLRAIEPSDLELIYQWENNYSIWNVSNTIIPFSKFVISEYIENSIRDIYDIKQLRLLIVNIENKIPVGAIDFFDFDPYHRRAGIGILIADEKNKKKGYATEALQSMIEFGFEKLQLKQLYCNIGVENIASIQLFEKIGFEKCGLKKAWLREGNNWSDELMYQLIR